MRSRRFDPIDIAVVSGGLATVFGAMLLWVSTQGTFQMSTQLLHTTQIDRQTIEEELGKTVVTASLIEQKHAKEISRAARKLNAETITAEHVDDSGNERAQQVVDERNEQERSKVARQEFVKGQKIVKATLRSKGPQSVSEDQWNAFNGQVMRAAVKEADRIDRVFRANAPVALNTALQNETQVHAVAQQKSQEQAREAIVETSVMEENYAAASASLQEQLGSLVSRATVAHIL